MHARWKEQGKGKVFDEIVCLGRTPSYGGIISRTNSSTLILFLVERCSDGSTYDACVSSTRVEGRLSFWDLSEKEDRDVFFISRFLKYFSELFKNICICIFLCVPLQFLGLLFTIFSIYYLRYYQNMKGIRELYEANIFESSKEVSEIVSLLFFIVCPFNFLRHFLLHLQDIVKMSHLNVI